jgi:hypothetical protein
MRFSAQKVVWSDCSYMPNSDRRIYLVAAYFDLQFMHVFYRVILILILGKTRPVKNTNICSGAVGTRIDFSRSQDVRSMT